MVLWATFSAIGGIFDRNESGLAAFEATREQLFRDADTAAEVVELDTTFGVGSTRVDVTVSNTGARSFSPADMDQWDVFLDYVPVGGLERRVARLAFAETLTDNTWVVRDIYLDYSTAQDELIDPGIVDPLEELVMRLQVSPLIQLGTEGRVVIHVPGVDQPLVGFFTIP
jgi:hypothetical protein